MIDVWDQCSSSLLKYDWNGDDEFSVEEFMMWMAVVDTCDLEV